MRAVLLSKHADERLIRLSVAEKDFIQKFSIVFDDANIEDISKALNDSAFHIERNADLRITFLNLSLYISRRLIRQKAQSN
jgi:DNA polymerase-3 subunit delta'